MIVNNLLLRARKLISAQFKIELANFNSFPPLYLNRPSLHMRDMSKEILQLLIILMN